jgi:hypothetical protein
MPEPFVSTFQNPKLVLVRPDTAALDARQNLNPPHKFTLGYVANYGISDVTSVHWVKSQRLLDRTLTAPPPWRGD